jgi:diguanylate cyclase (GGDEF)-like protein
MADSHHDYPIDIAYTVNDDFGDIVVNNGKHLLSTEAGGKILDMAKDNVRDPLTGMYNRGFFDRKIADMTDSSEKPKFTAIMLDIDHFKDINDKHGHLAGDAILRGFSLILTEHLRPTDGAFVARYGGEEFVVLIPGLSDKAKARDRAEDIRKAVESSTFRISDTDGLNITASVGVGVWDGELTNLDFIEEVDNALYKAKRGGRNQVVLSK